MADASSAETGAPVEADLADDTNTGVAATAGVKFAADIA